MSSSPSASLIAPSSPDTAANSACIAASPAAVTVTWLRRRSWVERSRAARPRASSWSTIPTSADLLSPARRASALCELPGLAAISASTVSDPVGSPYGAETAIERAVNALRSSRTRGPTDPARMPESSVLPSPHRLAPGGCFCTR